jgi:hypothetical protein
MAPKPSKNSQMTYTGLTHLVNTTPNADKAEASRDIGLVFFAVYYPTPLKFHWPFGNVGARQITVQLSVGREGNRTLYIEGRVSFGGVSFGGVISFGGINLYIMYLLNANLL